MVGKTGVPNSREIGFELNYLSGIVNEIGDTSRVNWWSYEICIVDFDARWQLRNKMLVGRRVCGGRGKLDNGEQEGEIVQVDGGLGKFTGHSSEC